MISFDFKPLFSIQSQKTVAGIRASHLLISSFLLMAFLATLTIAVRIQPIAAAAPVLPTPISVNTSAPATVTPTTEATPSPTAAPAAKIATPLNCTPAGPVAQPAVVNLLSAANGLTQVIDTPVYYTIFGNTSAQIQAQLQSCAPRNSSGETFAGEAAYTLVWQYTSSITGNGLCTTSDVKVGLHTTMTLPAWSASKHATSGLASKWNVFINNLTHHENGHIALDKQYANILLNDLENYPATDCATLATAVQAKASAILADLNAANSSYDNHTDHGATQGAIIP